MALVFVKNALQVNFELEQNTVISTIRGSSVAIFEEMFVGICQSPTEGIVVLSELPERLVAHMRMEFSESMVPVHSSCNKKEMKEEYRLLNDIIAKALTAKAGSFDAVIQSHFDLMVDIMGGFKINWSKILFRIMKAMVVPSTKQAHAFAVQLSLLLEGVPSLKLGESKALPSLKILSVKSVNTYVAKNKSAQAELVEEKNQVKENYYWESRCEANRPNSDGVSSEEKINLLEDSDSKYAKPLPKDIKVSAPVALAVTTLSQLKAVGMRIAPPGEAVEEQKNMCWETINTKRRLFTVDGGRSVNQVHDRNRSPSNQPALEG
ncbi:hypothetical protein F511_34396 [Dorcoceras hygrometricum]|uniref:Uncharacterized protein n=1 Tax=Dorcoceras hygrometricum TaxID=472368 RepID=A0A2Z7AKC6_9LAMI|nr:hypothetical protein F511_34396 [Dorcoceras hygrometricum]